MSNTAAEKETRLRDANAVCQLFVPDTSLHLVNGHIVVEWTSGKSRYRRRWMTRGQGFYPVWHRWYAHGGTCTTAVSQLVRWVQGKPVLPLSTWRYWTSPTVDIGQNNGAAIVAALDGFGYPKSAKCVLCGRSLSQFDWWSLEKVSGPCCNYRDGCRQKPHSTNGMETR